MKIETQLARAGLCTDEKTGAISTPIHPSATFRHESLGCSTGFDYSRTSNPTRAVLEKEMASLEGGYGGFAFSSGMAAVTAVASLFSHGDHLVLSDDLYGGTYRFFKKIAERFGIRSDFADLTDIGEAEKAIQPRTKALFIETPTNPMMKISDIAALSSLAKKKGILSIVDNTFMTPYLQQPIKLGADIIIHSGTKYIGGHNDVLCGIAVCATKELSEQLGFIQNATGGVLSPFDTWLVIRGLKTLALRVDRSQDNAGEIAVWLSGRRDVTAVFYPGLLKGRDGEIHRGQSRGSGAMVSFCMKDKGQAEKVINSVKIISFAESLGGVESLITYPAVQTHSDVPAEIREKLGITDTLLRLSVGIEDCQDLIDDLKQAMEG